MRVNLFALTKCVVPLSSVNFIKKHARDGHSRTTFVRLVVLADDRGRRYVEVPSFPGLLMQFKPISVWCVCFPLFFANTTSRASKIYKCAGPSGSTIFSETPCGKDAQELEIGNAEALPRPIEVAPPAKSASEERPPSEAAAPTLSFAPTEYPSYRCSTPDGMVFYRHQHCPRNVQVTVAGVVGNLSTETQAFAPVDEAGVSREIACKAIYPLVAAHRYGEQNDERYSTMERNQGKDPCK